MSTTSTSNAGGGSNKVDADTDWDDLLLFQVHPEHAETVTTPVYANGRQQVCVQIEIVAAKNGQIVTLTDNQLKRITLVAYETGEPFPEGVTTSCEKSPQYENDLGRHEDDLLAEIFDPRLEDHEYWRDAQLQPLWVSCSAVGRYKVAAEITSPSGVSYTTCAGMFDSWMIISAHTPLVHAWNALEICDRQDMIKSSEWDVDMYFIKFTSPNLRIVDSMHHNHTADHPFYSWPKDGWARKSSVAFQAGQARKVVFPPGIPGGCTLEVNTLPGQANAARVQQRVSHDLKQRSDFGKVTYFDQNGNSVPAVIAVSGNGNTLHLHSTEPHPLPGPSGKSAAAALEKLD